MQLMQNDWRRHQGQAGDGGRPCARLPACPVGLRNVLRGRGASATYPVEGKLVEVGDGRRIQIDCRGEGGPTVVFQSGGDMLGSLGWKPVMEKVAAQDARLRLQPRRHSLERSGARNVRARRSRARSSRRARSGRREAALRAGRPFARRALQHDLRRPLSRRDRGHGVRRFLPPRSGKALPRSRPAGRRVCDACAGAEPGLQVDRPDAAVALSGRSIDRGRGATPSIRNPPRPMRAKRASARATMEVAGRYRDLQNWPVVVLARELPEQTQARKRADAHDAYLLSADGLVAGVGHAGERSGVAPAAGGSCDMVEPRPAADRAGFQPRLLLPSARRGRRPRSTKCWPLAGWCRRHRLRRAG